jgi:hypothetical protein
VSSTPTRLQVHKAHPVMTTTSHCALPRLILAPFHWSTPQCNRRSTKRCSIDPIISDRTGSSVLHAQSDWSRMCHHVPAPERPDKKVKQGWWRQGWILVAGDGCGRLARSATADLYECRRSWPVGPSDHGDRGVLRTVLDRLDPLTTWMLQRSVVERARRWLEPPR